MCTELITTGVQKIRATYENNEIVFEIDFDHPEAKKTIKEMSRYWVGSPDEDAPIEHHLEFWLQIAGSTSYRIYCERLRFSDTYLSVADGFCDMDGRFGIKIISWNYFMPEPEDFEVSMVDIDYNV
ncbi:hypothetical protein J3U75_07460 [Snodgrassella sp. B3088]|uniref:hypothetical protein n=1 Tax=Snodgrassella sp. B3088 TaxID=2818038 RepID=UPI00226A3777|nr:hypothetical protein [Snodgrassella sp. B3088]MCX8749218.1 hypothetical protein [Snodgrassella sp. B3088]